MCGIAGIFNFSGEQVEKQAIKKMTDAIKHRGPDGEGLWIDTNIGLGHRRLSIIDLSDRANQPMISDNKKIVISFNGEIYNYKDLQKLIIKEGLVLKSDSDTEVILALYQIYNTKAFEMLRGMFAFALWDIEIKRLLLVRDRLGIKPLYYYLDENKIVFASEIKAIATVQPKLTFNINAFWKFVRKSTYTENETVFKEVKTVEPGTFLNITESQIKFNKYWNLIDLFQMPIAENDDDEQVILKFRSELAESIKYHMISDVPVGGFLSGGLDSSAVIGYMRKLQQQAEIHTSSIIFPEHPVNYNEEPYSDKVSKYLNTNHEKIPFRDDFLHDMDELAWYGDEPFGIVASYALYKLSEETSKKVKVVLTGDGADELLAGYQGYLSNSKPNYYNLRSLFRIMSNFIQPLVSAGKSNENTLNTIWLKLKTHSGNSAFNFANNSTYAGAYNYLVFENEYLLSAWQAWEQNLTALSYEELQSNSDLRKKLYSSMKTRLVDEMLTKVDRMTMAHSLEARVPFLDHKLVEYCVPLPDTLKVKTSKDGVLSKYILRKSSENILPKDIIYREKHGFNNPIDIWIRNNLNIILETISSGVLVRNGVLNWERLNLNAIKHKNKIYNNAVFIFNIYVFEKWYNIYKSRIEGFSLNFD